MEVRKCGDSWAFCDGNCENCCRKRFEYAISTKERKDENEDEG